MIYMPLAAVMLGEAIAKGKVAEPPPMPKRNALPALSNPEKNFRRQEIKALGRRQLLKAEKAGRRHVREEAE